MNSIKIKSNITFLHSRHPLNYTKKDYETTLFMDNTFILDKIYWLNEDGLIYKMIVKIRCRVSLQRIFSSWQCCSLMIIQSLQKRKWHLHPHLLGQIASENLADIAVVTVTATCHVWMKLHIIIWNWNWKLKTEIFPPCLFL